MILPALREYQKEAINAWFRAGKRGIISLPTGTGKTVIALKIWELLGMPKTLYVAPTNALIKDLAHKFVHKYGIPEHWISTDPWRPRRITFATYAMLAVHNPDLARDYDFYILDEVHHAAAEKFFENAFKPIIHPSGKPILGLSASPKTSAKYTLEMVRKYLPIVYARTWSDPEMAKYRPEVKVYLVSVPLTTKESSTYHFLEEQMRDLRFKGDFRSIVDASRILKDPREPRWRKALAGKYMKLYNAQKRILQGSADKKRAVVEIIEQHADEPRIILFADTIDDLVDVINELNRRGIPAFALTSKTIRPGDVKRINEEFGTRYQVLGLVKMGEEGLDFPDVSTLVVMGSPKSRRAVVQRSGRALRWQEGKVANIYVVYARGTKEEDTARRYVRELRPDEVIEIGVEDLEAEEELFEEKPTVERPVEQPVATVERKEERKEEKKVKIQWEEPGEEEEVEVYEFKGAPAELDNLIREYATKAKELAERIRVLSRDWFRHAKELQVLTKEHKMYDMRARVLMMVRDYLNGKISLAQFSEYLKPFGYKPNTLTVEPWVPEEARKRLLEKIAKDKLEAERAWRRLFRVR